jgi:tetratricopeptide (TPR) repeat protein
MHRNPWFTLVLGVMIGLVLGYLFAERQAIPPASSQARQTAQGADDGLPEGHPPIPAGSSSDVANPRVAQHAAELQQMLAQSPDDHRIMVALGNLYYDAERWQEARIWYERSLEIEAHDPDVFTDLAVVYRRLGQPETSLQFLDRAIAVNADHWQAWYNRVIVLHFDLHRHDEANGAFRRLESIARDNPAVPDLSQLKGQLHDS